MKNAIYACFAAISASAVFSQTADFSYSQTDSTTGSGTIAPFTLAGHDFLATTIPAPTVLSPGGAAPAGFVGRITAQSGSGNEANQAVGLLWSGSVTATATDGATVQIPLVFAPKQTQTPADISDYHWNVTYGDSLANADDVVGAALRFAMFLSRDTTIDAVDTANTFQRYTQLTQNLVAGQDNLSNTDTTNATIKDAQDAGAPAGTDAVGRNLEFYWAWRDGGALGAGTALLVDDFSVSGILVPEQATLVPEPSTYALLGMGALALAALRHRK